MRYPIRILPLALSVFALTAITVPAIASARRTVAPPGDSGISQYLEVVPTGTGASPPRTGGGVGSGAGVGGRGAPLTTAQRRRLNALGPDGRTLAAVVEATAPQSLGVPVAGRGATNLGQPGAGWAGAASQGAVGSLDSGATNLPSATGGSPVSQILDAATGRGGGSLGFLLPGFMLASAIGVTLVAVRRRRPSP
jgi:hypothetical protein